VVLLTDTNSIARQLGIDRVIAEVLESTAAGQTRTAPILVKSISQGGILEKLVDRSADEMRFVFRSRTQ
jgi:predicted aspartyl protease